MEIMSKTYLLSKRYELVMLYDLDTINHIRQEIKKGNQDLDYSKVGDLAYMEDAEHNTSVYLGGYVDDKGLSITFSEGGSNINSEQIYWFEIDTIDKLYNTMLRALTLNNYNY